LHFIYHIVQLKEILIRTVSGIVFLIIVIGSILIHPVAFLMVFGGFTFIGLKEYFKLTKVSGKILQNTYVLIGLVLYFLIGLIGLAKVDVIFSLLILLLFPIIIAFELYSKKHDWSRTGSVLTGYFYVAIPFGLMNSFFLLNHDGIYSIYLLLSFFVIVWCNDIFAYLSGSFFGKHKLFERISPKKTWEGSAGGLLFALLAAYILSFIFKQLQLSFIEWMFFAVIVVIAATIGDLSESMLKRNAGVKDSGKLMPGHGGVLDRFDAILYATPFVFIYIKFLL